MCLNAMVFNTTGDEYWREAKRYHEEVQNMFRLQKRKSHSSAYGFELTQLIDSYNATLEAAKVAKSKAGHHKRKTPAATTSVGRDETGQAGEEKSTAGDVGGLGIYAHPYSNGPKRAKFAAEAGSVSNGQSDMASESATDAGDASPRPPSTQSSNGAPTVPAGAGPNKGKVAVFSAVLPPPEDTILLDDSVYLPVQLVPSPDPSSFMPCTVVSQSVEESFFLMCQDTCLVCGSAGKSEVMLFCVDCGEAVHTFCSDAPLSLMSDEARAGWRCMNCKFCQVCNTSAENEAVGKMLYCEGCDSAFHGHCLSPRLEATPETSWYCAECVKCTTCTAGSSDTMLSKCWGFDLACCYNCTLVEQARRAVEEAEEQKKQLELLRRQDPAVCNICWKLCTVPYVMCSACGRNSHVECNPTNALPMLKNGYEAYRDYLCLACSSEHMPSCVSHLGTGPHAAALLSLVARIQRTRKERALQAQARRLKVLEEERIALFESHRRLFRTVVHLAILRMQWFATFSGANGTQPVFRAVSTISSSRAVRFLALWRRRAGDSDASVAQRQQFLRDGLDANGQEMSAERLVRVATLASAYLAATTADVRRFVSRDIEIAPAVHFMLRLHQESLGATLSSGDVAAIAAASSIQFMGFETSLDGAPSSATSSTSTPAHATTMTLSELSALPVPVAAAASASATIAGTVALVKMEKPLKPSVLPLIELIEVRCNLIIL